MKIKILTDSTCDLSSQILDRHDITLVPLTVIKNDQEYKDNVTITPGDIFAHVAAGGDLCSTTAVSIGEYEAYFSRFAGAYDGVIHITRGSGFSSTYQNACIAAEEVENVYVVDSRNLSTGHGLVVCEAVKLVEEGKLSPAEIAAIPPTSILREFIAGQTL